MRRRYPRELDGMGLDRRSRAYADMLYRGLRTAADRMAAQCAALGGDGVLGVQLQASRYRGDKRARQRRWPGRSLTRTPTTKTVTN